MVPGSFRLDLFFEIIGTICLLLFGAYLFIFIFSLEDVTDTKEKNVSSDRLSLRVFILILIKCLQNKWKGGIFHHCKGCLRVSVWLYFPLIQILMVLYIANIFKLQVTDNATWSTFQAIYGLNYVLIIERNITDIQLKLGRKNYSTSVHDCSHIQ